MKSVFFAAAGLSAVHALQLNEAPVVAKLAPETKDFLTCSLKAKKEQRWMLNALKWLLGQKYMFCF